MDFNFLENPISHKWVVIAPKRAKRPDVALGPEPVCPFCPGHETRAPFEVYRIGHGKQNEPGWEVRVVPNKFPFAPNHEIIIHSPDHHKNFAELSLTHNIKIFQTYRHRFFSYQEKGQVFIFHNHGRGGGESLPHPHTQLAVVPFEVMISADRLGSPEDQDIVKRTRHFTIFCPKASGWPYEVWFAPKKRGMLFSEISNEEIRDLCQNFRDILIKLSKRLGHEFPFNFYIYPGGDWYLRLIPRTKTIGGFELGTGIFVNTQEPQDAVKFFKKERVIKSGKLHTLPEAKE